MNYQKTNVKLPNLLFSLFFYRSMKLVAYLYISLIPVVLTADSDSRSVSSHESGNLTMFLNEILTDKMLSVRNAGTEWSRSWQDWGNVQVLEAYAEKKGVSVRTRLEKDFFIVWLSYHDEGFEKLKGDPEDILQNAVNPVVNKAYKLSKNRLNDGIFLSLSPKKDEGAVNNAVDKIPSDMVMGVYSARTGKDKSKYISTIYVLCAGNDHIFAFERLKAKPAGVGSVFAGIEAQKTGKSDYVILNLAKYSDLPKELLNGSLWGEKSESMASRLKVAPDLNNISSKDEFTVIHEIVTAVSDQNDDSRITAAKKLQKVFVEKKDRLDEKKIIELRKRICLEMTRLALQEPDQEYREGIVDMMYSTIAPGKIEKIPLKPSSILKVDMLISQIGGEDVKSPVPYPRTNLAEMDQASLLYAASKAQDETRPVDVRKSVIMALAGSENPVLYEAFGSMVLNLHDDDLRRIAARGLIRVVRSADIDKKGFIVVP